MGRALCWLRISAFSAHGQLAPVEKHYGRRLWGKKAAKSMVAGEKSMGEGRIKVQGQI